MIILVILSSFSLGMIVNCLLYNYSKGYIFSYDAPTSDIYEFWQGGMYEVLHYEVLDEDSCLQHLVVYRALYGRRNIYALPKDKFFGKVSNRQGELVDRFKLVK